LARIPILRGKSFISGSAWDQRLGTGGKHSSGAIDGAMARRHGPAIVRRIPMTRPFEGVRIIDITHVLAGPFATYQLGLLGADVIKIEDPNDPDQSRDSGTDND
jgi:CoA-transferase family III